MNFLTSIRIRTRLALGFGVVLVLAIAALIISVGQLRSVAHATQQLLEKPQAKERLAADWYRNTYASIRRTNAILKSSDDSLTKYFEADTKALTASSNKIQEDLEAVLETDEEKAAYDKIVDVRKKYIEKRNVATQLKAESKDAEMMRVFEQEYEPVANQYEEGLRAMVSVQRKAMDVIEKEIQATYQNGMKMMAMLAGLLIALATLCAYMITRSITVSLNQAVAVTSRIASGDLTNTIETSAKDEIGDLMRSLRSMNDGLVRVVSNVQVSAQEVAGRSAEIASGNLDLSSRTEEQAASLEETASSMEELTSTVKQNADNARQANQLAVSASDVAVKGGDVVSQVVTTMGSINDSARKIADIIGVIDGIAFQTNILALNAAVEAARAGEQGRGFAVVATEVRTLAQRSAEAAKEIKELIGDSVGKVDAGSKLVGQAGATMTEIVDSVKRVTDIMAEIMAATQEQSAGIDQVNQVIVQMDQVTQQNAALVEEAAASAESLQGQAGKLAQDVSFFKVPTRR